MRPWGLVVTAAVLLSTAASVQGNTSNPFDRKMVPDRQAVHVLNRLTFGARPGDLDEVRRIGIEIWIRQQLHPSSIPEDDTLAATLQSLPSLRLATWEIIEKYRQPQPSFNFTTPQLTELLTPEQRRQLTAGTGDERRAVLATLSADARRQALSQVPSQVFEAFPI